MPKGLGHQANMENGILDDVVHMVASDRELNHGKCQGRRDTVQQTLTLSALQKPYDAAEHLLIR